MVSLDAEPEPGPPQRPSGSTGRRRQHIRLSGGRPLGSGEPRPTGQSLRRETVPESEGATGSAAIGARLRRREHPDQRGLYHQP